MMQCSVDACTTSYYGKDTLLQPSRRFLGSRSAFVAVSRDTDPSSLAHSKVPGSAKGAPEFEVEEVLAHRQRSSHREYLVKWKGLPTSANSWELPGSLSCPELLEAYNSKDSTTIPDSSNK